jgi:hypothetical protein
MQLTESKQETHGENAEAYEAPNVQGAAEAQEIETEAY